MYTAILVSLCIAVVVSNAATSPNIVIIMADDLGWNDVSFHGSNQFLTPNIDALAYSGVILKDYYTQPICTPARAALLTGRHPIHNGMEHDVLYAPEPWGLPLTEKILPEYLKPLGYTTRAIGKWHLGFFKSDYTPSRRGFDTHYGNWLGELDHFTHYGSVARPGYDFRRELNLTWEDVGKYAADVFTEEAETIINNHDAGKPLFLYVAHVAPHAPLQAPQPVIDRFQYIPEKKRQIFAVGVTVSCGLDFVSVLIIQIFGCGICLALCTIVLFFYRYSKTVCSHLKEAMVTKVDESVGRITKALKENNMLNNSIILFLSDNGGATNGFNGNVASNFPLRGCKDTLWEGGVRGVGLIWSPLLKGPSRVHRGLFNVQDWLPTLLTAVNETIQPKNYIVERNLDGVSQWNALNGYSPPPYSTMLHNIDPVRKIAALRDNDWKIVTGRTYNGRYDGFYGQLSGKVPYDVNIIKTSDSGRAVQSTTRPLPDSITLLKLRARSVICCNTTKETPHVIQVRQILNNGSSTTAQSSTKPKEETCQPHVSPCLFNIANDPCEMDNLAESNPIMVHKLLSMIEAFHLTPPNNKPGDPRSYPVNWNNTWISWRDFV